MHENIKRLKGANMDIDLASPLGSIAWEQDGCPWNDAEQTDVHTPAPDGKVSGSGRCQGV